MGYASTIPFQTLFHTNLFGNSVSASTVAADYTLGYFVTPSWDGVPTTAYVNLVCQSVQNTNGNPNYLTNLVDDMDFALSPDTITYTLSGHILNASFYSAANDYQLMHWVIPGTVNLAAYLSPNTTYYCDVRNIKSGQNNLVLRNWYAELLLTFGG